MTSELSSAFPKTSRSSFSRVEPPCSTQPFSRTFSKMGKVLHLTMSPRACGPNNASKKPKRCCHRTNSPSKSQTEPPPSSPGSKRPPPGVKWTPEPLLFITVRTKLFTASSSKMTTTPTAQPFHISWFPSPWFAT